MGLDRERKVRERLIHLFELDLAALRDFPGAIDRVGNFAEERHHFSPRLHVELGMAETHPVRIRHGFAGLDAHQNLMRASVVTTKIMRVVRGNERDAGFRRHADQLRSDNLVLIELVILDFEKEVVAAKQIAILVARA